MKKLLTCFFLALVATTPAHAVQVGAAYQVYRMPSTGTIPKFGSVDLSQSAATTNQLPASRGGSGVNNTGTFTWGSNNITVSTSGATSVAVAPTGTLQVDGSDGINNCTLTATVGSNALTVTLKTKSGATPSATDTCYIGFRNVTLTSGDYTWRSVTAATSVVVSSGSTLGHASGLTHYIYVYGIDNAGTVELGVSTIDFDEGTVQTSTAEGGAGAADSNRVLYSTTARTSKPIRMIGRVKISEATAGTWATSPTEISLPPFNVPPVQAIYSSNASQSFVSGNLTIVDYEDREVDTHNAVTTGAAWKFTAPKDGRYMVTARGLFASNSFGVGSATSLQAFVSGALVSSLSYFVSPATYTSNLSINGATILNVTAGQYIDIQQYTNAGSYAYTSNSEHIRVSISEMK